MASLIAIRHQRCDSVIRILRHATRVQGCVSTVQRFVHNLAFYKLHTDCNSIVIVIPGALSIEQYVGVTCFGCRVLNQAELDWYQQTKSVSSNSLMLFTLPAKLYQRVSFDSD